VIDSELKSGFRQNCLSGIWRQEREWRNMEAWSQGANRCEGIKSNDHLLRCPAHVALLGTRVARFEQYFLTQETCPKIVDLMVYVVRAWTVEETGEEVSCSAATAARQPS
jgi:hypothetical protein